MANPINSSPLFTQLGNVFGRFAAQWNQYFSSKVDAEAGQADNLTLTGSITLNGVPLETFNGADLPLAQTSGSGVLILQYAGSFGLNGSGDLYEIPITSTTENANFAVSIATGTYFLDTVSTAITAILPASPVTDMQFTFKDATGHAATHNITINGNGKNIDASATASITTNYGHVKVQYNGTQWSVI